MPSRERRKTASKDESRAAFEMGDVTAPPGKLTRVELPVSRLPTGAWLSLPIGVLHGLKNGPVIWISGAVHGDELLGVPIVRHVLDRIDPKDLSGTILAVPVLNVFGLIQESRYLPDRRDLNRSFPGSKRGSTASQLAHLFMKEVVSRSEVGLDLHTGSDGRVNLPQVRSDLDQPATRRLALEFGATVLLHSRLRDGSLRAAAAELGKTVLLYEAGEANRFDSQAIHLGVGGVMRVIKALGMIEYGVESAEREPQIYRASSWVRARRTGFCEMMVSPGAEVHAGEGLAVIFDALGRDRSMVRSNSSGIVIGHTTSALVHRGDAIAHVARTGG
ncbi:MAG: succinylglutamate desuccinylase/aspartoacylase family protein [Myxococcales bacterium]|jgi:predicted deacylase